MRRPRSSRSLLLFVVLTFAATGRVLAAPLNVNVGFADAEVASADPITQAVAQASQRFGVPAHWIRAVMRVESGGDVGAVSAKGAIGFMQVMPNTYAELRARYGLGPDPFAVRDNILAGAAYLRELADRYGAPGFLAAYNAGPARYEAYVSGVQPLPQETLDYLARLRPVIVPTARDGSQQRAPSRPPSPLEAPLFVRMASSTTTPAARSDSAVTDDRPRGIVEANATHIRLTRGSRSTADNELAPSSRPRDSLFPLRPIQQ